MRNKKRSVYILLFFALALSGCFSSQKMGTPSGGTSSSPQAQADLKSSPEFDLDNQDIELLKDQGLLKPGDEVALKN